MEPASPSFPDELLCAKCKLQPSLPPTLITHSDGECSSLSDQASHRGCGHRIGSKSLPPKERLSHIVHDSPFPFMTPPYTSICTTRVYPGLPMTTIPHAGARADTIFHITDFH